MEGQFENMLILIKDLEMRLNQREEIFSTDIAMMMIKTKARVLIRYLTTPPVVRCMTG